MSATRQFPLGLSRIPLFTFWEPRDAIHPYLRMCMKSWERISDVDVILLDYSNMGRYFNDNLGPKLKDFPLAQQADVIRYLVLSSNPGIWIDVDTIIYKDPVEITSQLGTAQLLLIGNPGKSAFMAFAGTTQKHVPFIEEILEDCRRLVVDAPRPEPIKWDYLGEPFYRRIADTAYEPHEVRILDWRDHGVFPEAIHGNGYGVEHYRDFWFGTGRRFDRSMVDQSSGLVMLHNSWTPHGFRSLTQEDIAYAAPEMLAQHLRYALRNDGPLGDASWSLSLDRIRDAPTTLRRKMKQLRS